MKIKIKIGVVVVLFITLLFNSIQVSAQFAVIYEGRYGYDAVAHFDDGVLYKGRYGYDAILHIDGHLTKTQLFAILLIDLVY